MKEIVLVRHANWDTVTDELSPKGAEDCVKATEQMGVFAVAIASPAVRTQQTAELLSGKKPRVDARVGIIQLPQFKDQVAELRKTHPLGVVGAVFSIPELREPLQQQGAGFKELLTELFAQLQDNERGLVVSHDGTMMALEKTLTNQSFDGVDHTFGELEGFRLTEDLHMNRL